MKSFLITLYQLSYHYLAFTSSKQKVSGYYLVIFKNGHLQLMESVFINGIVASLRDGSCFLRCVTTLEPSMPLFIITTIILIIIV